MLARHYEQPLSEVRRWAWPMFCALWARCIDDERTRLVRERRRKRKAEAERELAEMKASLDGDGFDGDW